VTDQKTRVVLDTDTLLADLNAWWAQVQDSPPLGFSGDPPRRIAGGEFDQAVADGTVNPYWEIIRQLPVDDMPMPWRHRPEPSLHWAGSTGGRREFKFFADRFDMCSSYSWGICTPGDIAWMTSVLGGQGVVECGAGTGYWAWQLRQAGVDVAAYDPNEAGVTNGFARREWTTVLRDGHEASKHHSDRALFLCWPSYAQPWAAQSLACYTGDLLIFCGEGEGGCTADDDFFRQLETEWEEIGLCPAHLSYWGIHDELTAYRRIRGPRLVPSSWG
jgi:hypothetical protein